MNPLDDLKYIHERDAQDALGVVSKQSQQLTYTYDVQLPALEGIQNVVLAGMGGSALAASYIHSWPGLKLPFEIVRDYQVPAYVGPQTLFIASSYSGNTEETVSAFEQAQSRGAKIVVTAGGGKLEQLANAQRFPLFVMPKAEQPRYAVWYNFVALIAIFKAYNLLASDNVDEELAAAAQFLDQSVPAWAPTVPTASNPAKQLAQELMGKSVVIYAGPKLAPAAYKWKISCNENAKNVAWWNQYSEFNHNEFIGWTSHPTQKPYAIIDLRSPLEGDRINKRFEVSDQLLSGQRPAAEVVQAQGQTLFQQLVWTSVYGDFVTIYLALLNGLNPAPVDLVEKLKTMLG